jgi:hypothetical protein
VIHWVRWETDKWRGVFAGEVHYQLEAHRPTPSQAVWALYRTAAGKSWVRVGTFNTRRDAREWAEDHLWATTAKM